MFNPPLLLDIYNLSQAVDAKFMDLAADEVSKTKVEFDVPQFHPRSRCLSTYTMSCMDFRPWFLKKKKYRSLITIVCSTVEKEWGVSSLSGEQIFIEVGSKESETKTLQYVTRIVEDLPSISAASSYAVVGLGGGLILNIASFVAEQAEADLHLWPTTVLSIADCSGGKVRVNRVTNDRVYKHAYKSYYEPDSIGVDPQFLTSLPRAQIQIGLVEIIKHAVTQSNALANYLIDNSKEIIEGNSQLLKCAFWAAALKSVCISVDVEENVNGSRSILRSGHDVSDRLEEDQRFLIPHGIAVAIGLVSELRYEGRSKALSQAKKLFQVFGIPHSLEEFHNWKARLAE